MAASNNQETEALIIKLLKKLERKGKNIQSLLWRLMDEFEDEQFDEKNDENKVNSNNHKVSLLYNATYTQVCKVGHRIKLDQHKHLSIEPCIVCGHTNDNNKQNKSRPNNQQILQFLNNYNTNQLPYGTGESQKKEGQSWVRKANDKKWPLHYAAITGDIVQINQLIKNKNINSDQKRTDRNDKTPIVFAARYAQLDALIELIKNGANAMPTPDKANDTPYVTAAYYKHKAILLFFREYVQCLYNFDIDDDTNLECHKCYNHDLHYNTHKINGTMSNYVYCNNCTLENVRKVQKIQANNLTIERRIVKTLKDNPSISVDTLCQMKDVKSLHCILKQIMVSGSTHAYTLWLLDIDNFKVVNTYLTHAIADTKIQALGEILKKMEPMTKKQWKDNGYNGISNVWAFRQGGDEFALVVKCNNGKKKALQKLYGTLSDNIKQIKLQNMSTMKHITVSIGVCHGERMTDYEEMLIKADEAAEIVKKNGKNGIAIYSGINKKIYGNFNEFR